MTSTTTVRNHDGRALEVMQRGPVGGLALVLHLGTPNAAADIPQMTVPAHERGLRTVLYSRPGYAASTPAPGRSVVDAAGDTCAVLDALGIDRFVTLGWSGGGPPALACAARLPERCLAAGTLAGLAPYDADGLDWRAGAEENLLIPANDEELTALLQADVENLTNISGAQIAAWLGELASEVDKAALTGEFADALAESMRQAVSTGIAGWRDDYLSFLRPWGAGPAGPVRSRQVAGEPDPRDEGAPERRRGTPVAHHQPLRLSHRRPARPLTCVALGSGGTVLLITQWFMPLGRS
jgi:pimeloyl-ACP methyl ester carboxylesterase